MGEFKVGMTIHKFSEYTGLPPSTLRFYYRKELLSPHRLDNGYRVYKEEQIERALLIQSLRQAEIGIQEIKEFLASNKDEKELLVKKWELPYTFLWFKHQVKRAEFPFREAMRERKDALSNWGVKSKAGMYVRTVDVKSDYTIGEIGFVVNETD